MVTTRYSDQQESKSRQKVMRLYKRWHQPITKRFIKPPLLHNIECSLDRLLSSRWDHRLQRLNIYYNTGLFPDGSNIIGSTVKKYVGEKPTVYCTLLTVISMKGHQQKQNIVVHSPVLSTCYNHFIPIIVGVGKRSVY